MSELLSIPELRDLLTADYGGSRDRVTLSQWARAGRIPAQRAGRAYVVRRSDVPGIAVTLGLKPLEPAA